MYAPDSPEGSLRVQRVLIITLWVSTLVLLVLAGGILLIGPRLGWGITAVMVGMIGMLAMFFAAMLPPVRAGAENFRHHIGPDGTHRCQCRDCGRTFVPTPGSPTGMAVPMPIPQQRFALAQSVLRISPFAGVLVFMALVTAVVLEAATWAGENGSLAGFFISAAVLNLLLAVFLSGVSAVVVLIFFLGFRFHRNRAAREISLYSPQHGCTCAWCGRKNAPVSLNPR